jgi:hypothetical protein
MLRLVKANGSIPKKICQLVSSFFSTHALVGPTFAISMTTSQVQSGIARKKERKLENLSKV